MDKIITTLFLTCSLLVAEPIPKDKQYHIAATTFIAASVTAYARYKGYSPLTATLLGFSSSLAIGVAKEYYDYKGHGNAGIDDIFADAIGATLGPTLVYTISWEFD